MPMMKVRVTWEEIYGALRHGERMRKESLAKGLKDKHGITENQLEAHLLGAVGELLVAKALDIEADYRINTFKGPDLLDFVQVRAVSEMNRGLLLRPPDDPEHAYVLAFAVPEFQVGGWMWGQEVKQERFYRDLGNDRPKAWIVWEYILEPIKKLKAIVARAKERTLFR